MKKLFRNHLPLFLALGIFAVMGGLVFFVILPLHSRIQSALDDIQKFHATKENRIRQIGKLPELESRYDMILRDEGRLDILLTRDRIVDFVKALENMGRDSGVEITIASKDDNASKKKTDTSGTGAKKDAPKGIRDTLPSAQYLELRIAARGDYGSIAAFIHRVETAPFALDILAVQIGQDTKTDDSAGSGSAPPPAGQNPFLLSPGTSGNLPADAVTPPADAGKKLSADIDLVVYLGGTDSSKP